MAITSLIFHWLTWQQAGRMFGFRRSAPQKKTKQKIIERRTRRRIDANNAPRHFPLSLLSYQIYLLMPIKTLPMPWKINTSLLLLIFSKESKWNKLGCTKKKNIQLKCNSEKSKTDMWKKSWRSWEMPLIEQRGRQVWALCEQPDRGRVVKGSIHTLIIDKYKGDRGRDRERSREWWWCKRL